MLANVSEQMRTRRWRREWDSRFHRFFSHAAWDIDTYSMRLAMLVVTIFAPGATFFWAVDDTLCRKRGLTSRQESSGKGDSWKLETFQMEPCG